MSKLISTTLFDRAKWDLPGTTLCRTTLCRTTLYRTTLILS